MFSGICCCRWSYIVELLIRCSDMWSDVIDVAILVVAAVEVSLNCSNQAMATVDKGGSWTTRGTATKQRQRTMQSQQPLRKNSRLVAENDNCKWRRRRAGDDCCSSQQQLQQITGAAAEGEGWAEDTVRRGGCRGEEPATEDEGEGRQMLTCQWD